MKKYLVFVITFFIYSLSHGQTNTNLVVMPGTILLDSLDTWCKINKVKSVSCFVDGYGNNGLNSVRNFDQQGRLISIISPGYETTFYTYNNDIVVEKKVRSYMGMATDILKVLEIKKYNTSGQMLASFYADIKKLSDTLQMPEMPQTCFYENGLLVKSVFGTAEEIRSNT